jgi:hypothetical protein
VVVVEEEQEFNKKMYQIAMSRVLIKRERAHSRHTNPLLNRTAALHIASWHRFR